MNISRTVMTDFARRALGLDQSVPLRMSPLSARGSDRSYYRITWEHHGSAIISHYDPKRLENTYFADIGEFLHSKKIPAPKIIAHDPSACLIVLEDMGDRDLWSYRSAPENTRTELYQATLAIVRRLHSLSEADSPHGSVTLMDPFGPTLYKWERDYFRDYFVKGVCGINLSPSRSHELEIELNGLADRLCKTPRSLVHRDLQSQNVMIVEGKPFLIDFQGMRFGTPFYDLGSLLFDPYVIFSEELRLELLRFYYDLVPTLLEWPAFIELCWQGSAQRLMQALGAYGFLGNSKGLPRFLDHIPAGLGNLLNAARKTSLLPLLTELCEQCAKVIQSANRQ
jgi:N-acetylmuramate 1-kinase